MSSRPLPPVRNHLVIGVARKLIKLILNNAYRLTKASCTFILLDYKCCGYLNARASCALIETIA